MSSLPPPRRLAGPPSRPVPPPEAPVHAPPPAAQPPVQQIIVQPRNGVSAGQVVLIVLAVLLLAPVATCVVCGMAVGAGINSAGQARPSAPSIATSTPATPAPLAPAAAEPVSPVPSPEPVAPKATAEPPDPALFQWRYDTTTDEMSGKTIRQAVLVSETTYNFDFPYHGGTICALRIAEHPRNGLTVTVNIDNGQFTCHSFTNCRIEVRFDERPPVKFRGLEPASHDTKTIFLEPEKKFLKEIKNSSTMAIELPFFRDGNRVFKFNTANFQWQ